MDDKALSFLMFRAIRGVISNAESGDLPLFASTLGLPAHQYQAMLTHYFAKYGAADEISESSYEFLQSSVPRSFSQVLEKVLSLRDKADDRSDVLWLAHAIASAVYGEQLLWESMDLADVVQLQTLLAHYFPKWSLQRCGITRWQAELLEGVKVVNALSDASTA